MNNNRLSKPFASDVIRKYEALERKLLWNLHIYPTHNQYDDYFQEVCIALWKLACEYDSLEDFELNCPLQYIYQHLKWRILDCIRHEKTLHEDACEDEQLFSFIESLSFEDDSDFHLYLDKFCEELSDKHQKYLNCLLQKIKVRAKIGRTIAKNYGRSFRNFSKSKDKPTTAYSILLG